MNTIYNTIVCRIMAGLLIITLPIGAWAQEMMESEEMLDTGSTILIPQGVTLHIQFFDTQIYFPDSDIQIKVTIQNDSPRPYRYKSADDRAFNLEFNVTNAQRAPINLAESLIRTRASQQRIFYRDIILEPGEEYSFIENLQTFIEIPDAGIYGVSAAFYPELFDNTQVMLESANRLTLVVRPPDVGIDPIIAQAEAITVEILRQEPLTPDQVVERILGALQTEQWERYFLYTDLSSIFQSEPARARQFVRLSEGDQLRELELFRQQLQGGDLLEDITLVPTEFSIIRTTYTENEATVIAELQFTRGNITETKQYTYFLRRDDQYWVMYDYLVQNRGFSS